MPLILNMQIKELHTTTGTDVYLQWRTDTGLKGEYLTPNSTLIAGKYIFIYLFRERKCVLNQNDFLCDNLNYIYAKMTRCVILFSYTRQTS